MGNWHASVLLFVAFWIPRAWPTMLFSALPASGCNAYQGFVGSLGASFYWDLNEGSGTTATEPFAANTGNYVNSPSLAQAGPMPAASLSVLFNGAGSSSQEVTTTTSVAGSNVFSIMVWFKSTNQGGLMGFMNSQTGSPGSYDRHLYIGTDNKLYFGVYPSAVKVVTSTNTVTDGNWHMAVATLGTAGQYLYVDNLAAVGTSAVTSAQSYNGYWRIGRASNGGWTNNPTNNFMTGNLSQAAVFPSTLTATQIAQMYQLATKCYL